MYRDSYIRINLANLAANIAYLETISHKKLIAVIKANGYGAGDLIAVKAASVGVNFFAVSSLDEALQLRKKGIKGEILILGYVPLTALKLCKAKDLTIVSVAKDYIYRIPPNELNNLKIQLKIDTGMNRIGLFPSECQEVLTYLLDNKARVEGIYTHYAQSDDAQNTLTAKQYRQFCAVVKSLNYPFKYIHAANTDAAIHFKDDISNYIRSGIGLLGLASYPSKLQEVVSLYTSVINCKAVKKGSGVSYGQHYHAQNDEYILTLPLGYADGFWRANSGRSVYIAGEYAQIVGSICMDQLMVRTTKPYACGTKVEIFGEHLKLNKMAEELGTINYEILTALSDRLTRLYVDAKGQVLKQLDLRFD